ncbi:NBS-LRR type resistance protein [Cucumis melo var. makuwa]|uniref:NBS-LRR type resistance protein n=1 Tax=Cucumis melo var. makuwa TaxID=1194695 RepID=A0A5A7TSJ9_CUCMM|nr:NBS-LRR type resistance protein [Cucumis melo var. makuwa]
MPLPLKTILRFAEKVMNKDSGICYQLLFSLFGIGRKSCVLREDIIDFCNMREVKTLTLVAYMAGHLALLAINAYDETVYYLDTLRTTSRVDIRYVTNTAITIFRSQKNIQTSRKQPIWKTVKCPMQVGVVECGYYVIKYMRDIITNGSIVVTDSSSGSVECTHQSRDPEGCTYQSSDPKGYTYQSSDPEGCTYQSSDPEGCAYQSSDLEGCTYQSSDPEGYTYP